MNKRTQTVANFLCFAILIIVGSWISTQWFAKSMLFSNALDASFVNVGGLNMYSPHQIFVWLTVFWSSHFSVLLEDMLPFFVCSALGFWMLLRTSNALDAVMTIKSVSEIRNATLSVSNSYVDQVRENRPTPVLGSVENEDIDSDVHDSNVLLASIESAFLDEESGVFHDERELETAKTYRSDAAFDVEPEISVQPIEILDGEYVEADEPFEEFKSVRTNFNRIEQLKMEAEMADDIPFDGNETVMNLFVENDEEDFVANIFSNTEGFTQSKTVRATESHVMEMLEVELVDAKTARLDSGKPLTKSETLEVLSGWRPAKPEEILGNKGRFIKVSDPEFPANDALSSYSNLDELKANTTVKVSRADVQKMLKDETSEPNIPVPEPISEPNQRQTAIILPGWQSKSEDVVASLDMFIEMEEPDFPNSTVSVSKDLQDYLKEASVAELVDE